MIKVFVYGSLRKGYGNHDRLMKKAQFLREAETKPEYTLVSLGAFPAMIKGTTAIKGELYSVGLQTLAQLDILEGHPDFYKRTVIKLSDETDCFTYIYQLPIEEKVLQNFTIKSGDWNNKYVN